MYDSRMGILVSEMFLIRIERQAKLLKFDKLTFFVTIRSVAFEGYRHVSFYLYNHHILDRGVDIRGWYLPYIIT
jgi:hypothetical protein